MAEISLLLPFGGDARLADDALQALSTRMQKNCSDSDYELVAVEWESADLLGEERATRHGTNVRYFRHDRAIDAWECARLSLARTSAPFVGLVAGAIPLLTPRVLEHALLARKVDPDPLVVVPSYRLHATRQDSPWGIPPDPAAGPETRNGEADAARGYRLFEFASFASPFEHGFLAPFDDVNCLFVRRESLESALEGGSDEGLPLVGRLAERPQSKLVILAGEGAFTTENDPVARERPAAPKLAVPTREPLVLGVVPGDAQRFLFESTNWAGLFHSVVKKRGAAPYPMDP
jgi:hypothetical protein